MWCTVSMTVVNTMCGFGVQTQKYLEANKLIFPVGCADKAVLWIESHPLLVGALALGLALPQIAGIVLSQILISQIQDESGPVQRKRREEENIQSSTQLV
ncbi:hypothetical protein KUCAC02_022253 [Chaenocephalus aceratus]|nr:hypothetical protein KUCAC02_022253 [Chaenocephalus aceratus]